jgi:hypothetical protein
VPDGSFSFSIESVPGYTAEPSQGELPVNGSSVLETIKFAADYPVTFVESGLPASTSWSISLGGTTETANRSTLTFEEPNGNYSFTLFPVVGYSSQPSLGFLAVQGAAVSQTIDFTRAGTGPLGPGEGLLGLHGYEGLTLLVAAAVVLLAAAVILLMRRRPRPPLPALPAALGRHLDRRGAACPMVLRSELAGGWRSSVRRPNRDAGRRASNRR